MDAPELLGVVLEEHLVENAPEAVDVEVLQRFFGTLEERGAQIAPACLAGAPDPHCEERGNGDGDRIVEEMPEVVDSADAFPTRQAWYNTLDELKRDNPCGDVADLRLGDEQHCTADRRSRSGGLLVALYGLSAEQGQAGVSALPVGEAVSGE